MHDAVTRIRWIRSIPALIAAAALASVASASAGTRPWSQQAAGSVIGPTPWKVAMTVSSAFGANDASVFGDASASGRLDEDAVALAVRVDQERLASGDAPAAPERSGRVGAAFSRFAALPGGVAYASLGIMPGEDGGLQLAHTPPPSLVAMLLPRDR
jgi:hypothetical protein